MKTSKGRKRIPFLVRTPKGGLEWRDVVTDTVAGWMPLLFAYDSMNHIRMFVIPEDEKLYMREENGCQVVIYQCSRRRADRHPCIEHAA